ncbi:MAG: ribonuclease III [Bacteroidales bacterium]|nr:ribonuclease III [Bacteroidales bacterium]
MLTNLFKKIRLFSVKRDESYFLYYKILGFYPKNIEIYEQAFLHKSSSLKNESGRWVNNERLEFLGDAILDAIVADIVYHTFEGKKEGFLTNTRSKIVQRDSLNRIALELGLDKVIVISSRTKAQNSSIYGNALEALVGAIYIDYGYDKCREFVEQKIIKPYINLSQVARKEVNFKSKLIEWSQKYKIQIEFNLIDTKTDNNNNPIFHTQVLIASYPAGIGVGFSKKESQQKAAKQAMKKIQNDKEFRDQVFRGENPAEGDEDLNDPTIYEEETNSSND